MRKLHTLLVGMQMGTISMENVMEYPPKSKNRATMCDLVILLLTIYLKNLQTFICEDIGTTAFTVASFILAYTLK